MPYLPLNGTRLYYESHGDGPPLLLVAGLASDSQSWLPLLPTLAERFRVIVLDNRGVGRSPVSAAAYSIADLAEDVRALLDHLGLERVHLLGHSMGGYIAQTFALQYPERVDRLVLASTGFRSSSRNNVLLEQFVSTSEQGTMPEAWFRNFFFWLFTRAFFEDKAALDTALRLALTYEYPQPHPGFAAQVRAIAAFDTLDRLADLNTPALVLVGEEDILIPPSEAEALARALPTSSYKVLPHSAHAVFLEAPAAFISAVTAWLSR